MVGLKMTVEEVIPIILKDIPFFKTSGGGLTLSGGEPLMFMDFASSLLQVAKHNDIHTLVETCGLFSFKNFVEKIAPYCDQLYFDLKIFDVNSHKQYCGVSNSQILENLAQMAQAPFLATMNFLPRVPLIPGITNSEENLTQIAGLLHKHQLSKVALLDYNPLWIEKCDKIGKASHNPALTELESWLKQEQIAKSRSIFTSLGIEVV